MKCLRVATLSVSGTEESYSLNASIRSTHMSIIRVSWQQPYTPPSFAIPLAFRCVAYSTCRWLEAPRSNRRSPSRYCHTRPLFSGWWTCEQHSRSRWRGYSCKLVDRRCPLGISDAGYSGGTPGWLALRWALSDNTDLKAVLRKTRSYNLQLSIKTFL